MDAAVELPELLEETTLLARGLGFFSQVIGRNDSTPRLCREHWEIGRAEAK
jgi:hypothetical protein